MSGEQSSTAVFLSVWDDGWSSGYDAAVGLLYLISKDVQDAPIKQLVAELVELLRGSKS